MEENRPAQPRFLDLSALRPQTQEEVNSALHRLPELRLRPDRPEEEDGRGEEQPFFPDPVPAAMRGADLDLLSKVDIPWKMLTLDRPDTHVEMNIFTRIVYLTKLTLRCMEEERLRRVREKALALRRPRPSRGAESPSRPQDLRPEEFTYEYFSRLHGAGAGDRGAVEEAPRPPPPAPEPLPPPPPQEEKEEEAAPASPIKKKKRKGRKKKTKKRKLVVKKKVSKLKNKKSESKDKTKKKARRKKCVKKRRELGSGKTLVQMLKSKKTSKDTTPKDKDASEQDGVNTKV